MGFLLLMLSIKSLLPEKTDYSQDKLSVMRNQASQVYKLFEAVENKAEIEDNRARYF